MRRRTRWLATGAALALVASVNAGAPAMAAPPWPDQPQHLERLMGRAVLPAETHAEGPTSGQFIGGGANGVSAPFLDRQPVQGFSAALDNRDGSYLALSDNGFGALENSADYNLRAYTIRPDFATKDGGSGGIGVEGYVEFADPDGHVAWAITNHFTEERVLTGADFDVESIQRAPDGTLWVGDEFGPFLLHFSADGRLLEPPHPLPDVAGGPELRSPQTPHHQQGAALRIMNAVRTHARVNGSDHTPVMSPTHGTVPAVINADTFGVAGFPVVPWTVNDPARMAELIDLGVDGIISDRPDLLHQVVAAHDADGDGTPGDWILPDGRIDAARFDAQGHRGARNLRPENTLPAAEAALDNLVTTLEGDTGVSADGVSMIDHNDLIAASTCRRADGRPYTTANQVRVRTLTAAEIQSTYICDRLTTGSPQTNDPALSPVAVAYGTGKGLIHPYVMPTADQLLEFVGYYEAYYRNGAGAAHPDARVRADNAAVVRFNLETKVTPGSEASGNTATAQEFVTALASVVAARGLEARVDLQSFDWRTPLITHEQYPAIRTVLLFPPAGTAGLPWPSQSNVGNPPRVRQSGGFEGMALSKDGTKLYPLLEKPLVGGTPGELRFHEFDLATRRYTGNWWAYRLDPGATAIGDFVMHGRTHGLVIERDDSQGNVNGFKRVYQIRVGAPGTAVEKRLWVDLTRLGDPYGLSAVAARPGDVGLGKLFSFPFTTIESVIVFDEFTIGILNDNNFPFSVGRHLGSGRPDDNEFIIIGLRKQLRD